MVLNSISRISVFMLALICIVFYVSVNVFRCDLERCTGLLCCDTMSSLPYSFLCCFYYHNYYYFLVAWQHALQGWCSQADILRGPN